MNVEVLCTTDDPTDSLEHHRKIREDGFEIKVLQHSVPTKRWHRKTLLLLMNM